MAKYILYVCGWLGVVVGIAGITMGNGWFCSAGAILVFVYSFQARKDIKEAFQDSKDMKEE